MNLYYMWPERKPFTGSLCVCMCSQHRSNGGEVTEGLCVTLGDKRFAAEVSCSDVHAGMSIKFGELHFVGGGQYTSTINRPRILELTSDWCLGEPLMSADIDGRNVIVQVREIRWCGCDG